MKKKIVSLVLVFALALALGIGGTLAWLTAQTDEVVNTFTVGDITIDLYETDATDSSKTTKANAYDIVPGGTYAKDPTITVQKGSEKCWVYACVDNQVVVKGTTVATLNIDTEKWTSIGTNGTKTLYRYAGVTDGIVIVDDTNDAKLPLFTTVTFAGSITEEDAATVDAQQITVDAFAHQSDNTDQATADAAAKSHFGFPNP